VTTPRSDSPTTRLAGRPRDHSGITATPVDSDAILTVRGLSKGFHAGPPWRRRNVDVLRQLSLDVRAGELVGSLFGQLGATYLVLFLAMLGTGLLQDPMFGSGTPSGIALFFPDYGAMRVAIDGGFSASFHAWRELALALGWLALLVGTVALVLRHLLRPRST